MFQNIPHLKSNTAFYDNVFVDLQLFQTMVSSVPKNTQTSGLIDILVKHVKDIEAADKKATSTADTYQIL
jgi:hypothetical protein